MKRLFERVGLVFAMAFLGTVLSISASAQCSFSTVGTTMVLDDDCNTSTTIMIPDGYTLDFAGNTITAINPGSGAFLGGIVKNAGAEAHVLNASITTMNLTGCKGGDDRLRGILLDGASGSIQGGTVANINRGASGCQEGNGIEIRNAPFDGTGDIADRKFVTITNVDVTNWQKTGVVISGNVEVEMTNCRVSPSATQANLAANSVQISYGALARVLRNHIGLNSWAGPSAYAATGALIYFASPGTVFSQNILMEGNADVGIYIYSDGVTVENNKVFETGDDGLFDYGIGNWGSNNYFGNNKIKGFDVPVDGEESRRNVVIPSPH